MTLRSRTRASSCMARRGRSAIGARVERRHVSGGDGEPGVARHRSGAARELSRSAPGKPSHPRVSRGAARALERSTTGAAGRGEVPLHVSRLVDVDTFLGYCVHMDIGVRELKQHLSEYLERASRGEIIRVTDRGQPKAILGPVPGAGRVAQGIEEGWIRAGADVEPARVRRATAKRSVAEVLDEDRT